MTLDEAIKHAEEVAEEKDKLINKTFATFGEDRLLFKEEENECKKCADEHRQLAEWLKDYKRLLEQQPSVDCIARQSLIDNWNGCADMLMGECDSEIVMGWIFDAPPVTPTHGTCKDCRHCREDFSFTDKPMCLSHGLITINDDFYCKDYEKRGDSDGSN